MHSFDATNYVPILFTKRGERIALANSAVAVKQRLRPLFVVQPLDWDFENDCPRKSVAEHLSNLPRDLAQSWGTSDAFIDLVHIDDAPIGRGEHPLVWLVGQAGILGLDLTPVVSMNRSAAYMAAAASLASSHGVCLRLPVDEWPASVGAAAVDQLLNDLGISAADAHIVLDLADDVGSAAGMLASSELRSFPHLSDWRSITVAGTSVPETMPPGPGLHVVGRYEWRIYQALRGLAAPLPRLPTFGDYAIAGFGAGPDIDPRVMSISATLRYTIDTDILVAKGGLFKGSAGRSRGAAAVPPAAALLTGHADFKGPGHCGFDDWLLQVTAGTGGGSPEIWRRVGTEHHLRVVTNQIATLDGSSSSP